MSTPFREVVMAAAAASFAAMYPARHVERGLVDPAAIGDARLRQGVMCFVPSDRDGWNRHVGAEGNSSTLRFSVAVYLRVADAATAVQLEQAEADAEAEVLAWAAAYKAAPLDSVYPLRAVYSRGLEHPVGWVVLDLESLHV